MLSLEKMREIDPSLRDVSDAELEEVRLALYDAAKLAFDVYQAKKLGTPCPLRSLSSSEIKSKL